MARQQSCLEPLPRRPSASHAVQYRSHTRSRAGVNAQVADAAWTSFLRFSDVIPGLLSVRRTSCWHVGLSRSPHPVLNGSFHHVCEPRELALPGDRCVCRPLSALKALVPSQPPMPGRRSLGRQSVSVSLVQVHWRGQERPGLGHRNCRTLHRPVVRVSARHAALRVRVQLGGYFRGIRFLSAPYARLRRLRDRSLALADWHDCHQSATKLVAGIHKPRGGEMLPCQRLPGKSRRPHPGGAVCSPIVLPPVFAH